MTARVTDDNAEDKLGFTWEQARGHVAEALGVPVAEAEDLVEQLAVKRLLEPYQIIQGNPEELRGLLGENSDEVTA